MYYCLHQLNLKGITNRGIKLQEEFHIEYSFENMILGKEVPEWTNLEHRLGGGS